MADVWFLDRQPQEMIEVLEHDFTALEQGLLGLRLSTPQIDVPTWADRRRKMPAGSPFEGRWMTSRAPYFRRIAEKCSPSSNAEYIAVMKSGQCGATAAIVENPIGHAIEIAPRNILVLTATKGLAEEWSKKRFGPMVSLSGLSKFITAAPGGKGSGDTVLSKSFRGGGVLFASYNQLDFFRTSSFPVVIFDEFERADVSSQEGSIRKLGEVRTSMYENRRKIIMLSTPLEVETSKIKPAFDEMTREFVEVKCKHCKKWVSEFTLLDDAYQIKIDYETDELGRIVKPSSVGYPCPECGCILKNTDKYFFFKEGNYRWVKTNDNPRPKAYSFFVDSLIAAIGGVSWETLAQEWVDALRDPDEMRSYINLRGGRPFEYSEDYIDTESLIARKKGYARGEVPDDVLLTTCGCDLKKEHLDVVIKGFDDETGWFIEWRKFPGDPSYGPTGSLTKFAKAFSSRELPGKPKCAFIDMKYMGEEVIKCAESNKDIFAVGGEDWITGGDNIVESRTQEFGRRPFIRVNTGFYKGRITNCLLLHPTADGNPPGYQSFPNNFERAFYDQLNSEKRVPEYNKKTGKLARYAWRPRHTMGNHVFDCTVYAWAARDYQLRRIGLALKIPNYEKDVWEALRDPSHIEIMRQSGGFARS